MQRTFAPIFSRRFFTYGEAAPPQEFTMTLSFIEFGIENAARKLIEEFNRSEKESQEERITEIKEVLQLNEDK
jgi:hypothetical protein